MSEYREYIEELREEFNSKTEEFYCLPAGWVDTFVPQMLDDLFEVLGSSIYDWELLQVKEKYGTLTVYWCWNMDSDLSDEDKADLEYQLEEILDQYTSISRNTCAMCGEEATHMSTGWMVPLCDECDE